MFLAFIERLGWLSINGNKDYLYWLHQSYKTRPHKDTPTFYHVLELLFFSGLNSVNGIGGGHHLEPILGSVPYLNGGLFQRDLDLEPLSGIKIPDSVFEEIFCEPSGLFRRYTFTVTESTPLDVDVAVDPEMLGKIFEELVTGRHESGSYYTPRPVVSFMCRESLKGYLAENGIDPAKAEALVDEHNAEDLRHGEIGKVLELLGDVKVVDPACGSGAYLLGMMRELFDLIQIVERRREKADPRELYAVKLGIIRDSIYGVDIDPFAVNIARLRLWLSLSVDFTGDKPEPLPNLDFKIECGDSLTVPLVHNGAIENLLAFTDMDELAEKKARYLSQMEEQDRKALKAEIDTLERSFSSYLHPKGRPEGFDWCTKFVEVMYDRYQAEGKSVPELHPRGFDIVLANPPYVRADAQFSHLLPDKVAQQSAIDLWKEFREKVKKSKNFVTLHSKWDLYIPFLERAYETLKPSGRMVFIIPDSYNASAYAVTSHEFFLENSVVERIDFCSEINLFDAGVNNTIVHFGKSKPSSGHIPVRARRWGEDKEHFETNYELLATRAQLVEGDDLFRIPNKETRALNQNSTPLGHIFYISYGLRPNSDDKLKKGAFRTRDVISDVRTSVFCKPFLQGRNLSKYITGDHQYLEWGTARAPALFARPTFPEFYDVPARLLIAKVSKTVEVALDEDRRIHSDSICGLVPWHHLAGVVNRSIEKTASYSDFPGFLSRNVLEQVSRRFRIGFILSVLNSRPVEDLLLRTRRNKIQLYPDDWKHIPIPNASDSEQEILEKLSQQIIKQKNEDRNADVTDLQSEIDARVEYLYYICVGDETYDEWKARREAEAGTKVEALRLLISEHEGPTVEFKETLEEPDPNHREFANVPEQHLAAKIAAKRKEVLHSALKSICAMRNNPAGGTLVIGVKDDRTIIGLGRDYAAWNAINPRDAFLQKLAPALRDRFQPPLTGLLHPEFIIIDGVDVCRIDIPPGPPCYLDGTLYVRNLSTTEALTGPELEAWLKGKNQQNFGGG